MVLCMSLWQGSLIPDQPNTDLVRNQGTISKGHSYIGVRVPHFWSVQVGPGQESGTLSQRYSGRQWVKGPSLLIRFDGSLIPDQSSWGSGQESGTHISMIFWMTMGQGSLIPDQVWMVPHSWSVILAIYSGIRDPWHLKFPAISCIWKADQKNFHSQSQSQVRSQLLGYAPCLCPINSVQTFSQAQGVPHSRRLPNFT